MHRAEMEIQFCNEEITEIRRALIQRVQLLEKDFAEGEKLLQRVKSSARSETKQTMSAESLKRTSPTALLPELPVEEIEHRLKLVNTVLIVCNDLISVIDLALRIPMPQEMENDDIIELTDNAIAAPAFSDLPMTFPHDRWYSSIMPTEDCIITDWKCPSHDTFIDASLCPAGAAIENLIRQKKSNAEKMLLSFYPLRNTLALNSVTSLSDGIEVLPSEGLFGLQLNSATQEREIKQAKKWARSPNTIEMETIQSPLSSPRLPIHSISGTCTPTSSKGEPLESQKSSPVARSVPSTKDFEIIKPISKGAFGSVYLAKKRQTGDYYAIKVLRKSDMIAKNQVMNVKAERMVLTRTDSPFVVKLYYSFQSKDNLYLVMEYLNGGDCAALVKAIGQLDEKWARGYIAEVVLGLEFLHSRGIVHR